tara:strand:- start:651 stop:887 length:237 start_codon:yes stop_codon:yes gene_type:complete
MNVEEYFEVFTGGNSNTLTWTPRAIKDFAADYHEMREREKNKVNNVVLDTVSYCDCEDSHKITMTTRKCVACKKLVNE